MSNPLYMNGVTVNSEANARRIGLVEGCFGSAGQPLIVPGQNSRTVFFIGVDPFQLDADSFS